MTGSDLIDPVRIERYLTEKIEGFQGPLEIVKTETGQSNPTFILITPTTRYVLRRKPPGELLKSAHAVEREFRVMKALAASNVPVPRMLHLCEDEEVLGKPFFVMSHVEGRSFNDPRCRDVSDETRARVYDSMNATLAALHKVDVEAVGLSDFGRPGNYFERQLFRWTGQYRASETENILPLEELITWLSDNIPEEDGSASLVHGDWRIDNLLFDLETGKVAAVLDWELSTLGHPLADLGAQLMQWEMPTGDVGRGLEGVDRKALGLPENAAYVETYARRVGLSESPDTQFPVAFAFFRMAAILQGVKRRAIDGNASNPEKAMELGAYVPIFATKALSYLNAGS